MDQSWRIQAEHPFHWKIPTVHSPALQSWYCTPGDEKDMGTFLYFNPCSGVLFFKLLLPAISSALALAISITHKGAFEMSEHFNACLFVWRTNDEAKK